MRWPGPTCSSACRASTVSEQAIASMAPGSIVFALSNPTPEVHPEVARRHARVVATGRSDFPNQINNVLAFPGVFRAPSTSVPPHHREHEGRRGRGAGRRGGDDLSDYVSSSRGPFDDRVAPAVIAAVSEQARADGVATR